MVTRAARSYFWLPLLVFLYAFSGTARAERVEDLPKPTDYVSDYAHVLSPETVASLGQLCGQLDHSATNAQVAIVTVKTLDGDDVADFANRLEEQWKVGKKGSDRGILMLFAIQDRKRWIEVGYGLEGILPDGRVGEIGRAMVPYLRQQNYNAAITLGLNQMAQIIAADAKVTLQDSSEQAQQTPYAQQNPPQYPRPAPVKLTFGHLIFMAIAAIFALYMLIRHPWLFFFLNIFGGGGGGGGGWRGGDDDRRGGGGGDGFDGFGGGQSGGGGAGGDW